MTENTQFRCFAFSKAKQITKMFWEPDKQQYVSLGFIKLTNPYTSSYMKTDAKPQSQ